MIVTAVITSLAALAAAGYHGWQRGRKAQAQATDAPVIASGTLLVTDRGEVVIDVPLPRMRSLLLKSELAASVEFTDVPPPHCGHGGDGHDELHWDVIERQRGGPLFLVITWHVRSPRNVEWKIFGG